MLLLELKPLNYLAHHCGDGDVPAAREDEDLLTERPEARGRVETLEHGPRMGQPPSQLSMATTAPPSKMPSPKRKRRGQIYSRFPPRTPFFSSPTPCEIHMGGASFNYEISRVGF